MSTTIRIEDEDDQSNGRFEQLQTQVSEITDLMHDNFVRIRDREGNIDNLMVKADDLRASADTFQKTTTRIRHKYWWRNTRMKIIIFFVVLVILVIVVVIILYGSGVFKHKSDPNPPAVTTTSSSVG